MSMYPWRAGEVITAERLTAGMQRGMVAVELTEEIENTGSNNNQWANTYRRGSVRVTFDVPFAEVPTIQVTPRTNSPGVFLEASYTDVSTTGVTIFAARGNTTATNVDWLAIGRPAL
ncbi:H-type lectin domain-containing protein [Nocardiopsis exhalans]|uniref:H-type lectin domain-containing protein n=1 Tax=Nocardiopsis exhalans TaxID=163604 RepID=A0ABY5D923_9ACTN|nr:H-type lectin domain-containing protein [Nocardiopsis exhalans]USY19733.1 H-type lectin domain-containing protein [Nocardiopsis exhalans]